MPAVNPGRLELETAQEILVEVFGARPSDVEEMIRLRLEGGAGASPAWSLAKWEKDQASAYLCGASRWPCGLLAVQSRYRG